MFWKVDKMGTGMFTFESMSEVIKDKLKDVDTLEDLLEELKKLDKERTGGYPTYNQIIYDEPRL